jgi:transposase InsO family protein
MQMMELMYMSIEKEQENENHLSVSRACSVLGVSRDSYYGWVERKQSPDLQDPYDMDLRNEIHRIADDFPFYGYRRVTRELDRREYKVNHKKVLGLMREYHLTCMKNKRFIPKTTDSEHNFQIYPNLAKDMEITTINQLWVADITYVHLVKEFVYLAVIIDVFSRRCIGWGISRDIDAQLAVNALDRALKTRKDVDLSGLIHHSDQGVQYASDDYINRLNENGIEISMGRKGNPYDNAFAESFIKTLKYEEVYLKEYESYDDAYRNIKKFIEDVYNEKRLHSSIGYLPPNEFEKKSIFKDRVS